MMNEEGIGKRRMYSMNLIACFILMSMVIGLTGCNRGPSKKEFEQAIRESCGVKENLPYEDEGNRYTYLFPREEWLDPKYKTQNLKLEELRVIKIEKAQDMDEWRVTVHVKISATLVPKPAPGASWLRAYDHYEVPTSSKRIEGEGEHVHNIYRDNFGKLVVH